MRNDWLVFLHVLAGTTTVGALLATATLLAARRSAGGIAVVAVVAAIVTAVLGEITRAQENLDAHWLDVSLTIAYAAVLLPAIVIAFLVSIADGRPRLARWTALLALAVAAVTLVVAFLMAAKPG